MTILCVCNLTLRSQNHPEIYVTNGQKDEFLQRIEKSARVQDFVRQIQEQIDPYVERHVLDPEWIVSRLQMYWQSRYKKVFVNGMDFSHGAGEAPVPTVRFSGSRDWNTDYLQPALEDVLPYMDDKRGLYLQNGAKKGQPWEWVHPSQTGHIIERINEEILDLAENSAFIYWLTGELKYAVFASDILSKYLIGMYHREPPLTIENHGNAELMGLQTFEVIHERIVVPITLSYDFLYDYLKTNEFDVQIAQSVFKRWADQEIKFGVPGNNWNMMQARYITYLALALEDDSNYFDGKGQQYYIDQVLNQNSKKQKALRDVLKNYHPETAIWPEVASYSMMVSDDLMEIYCLVDRVMDNNLLAISPILEKAILSNFQYLFPNDFTVSYGDAKHSRLRFNSLELLVSQYRKYKNEEKEALITSQLKRYIQSGIYQREKIESMYRLFFYVDDLIDVPAAPGFDDLVSPTFYSPNVSWFLQRNGNSNAEGMMISKNASLGNHSHTNGINIELFAKGMVVAPDAAAGKSYWSVDHKEYYSRYPAHNTVIVDGISDYRDMRGTQAFEVEGFYPSLDYKGPISLDYTFSNVSFTDPSTGANQIRLTGTVRTSQSSGYFVDIFRSGKPDMNDRKNEYLFHGQGSPIVVFDKMGTPMKLLPTGELSSEMGDQKGYDYFYDKHQIDSDQDFKAQFRMPTISGEKLNVDLWMKGFEGRKIFCAMAPYSRAVNEQSVHGTLYRKPTPTLIVRQSGGAMSKPFFSIIDVYNESDKNKVESVEYFTPLNLNENFVGATVQSGESRQDFVYNANGGDLYIFKDGEFSGVYGVITIINDSVMSMLLGKGKSIEQAGWKISCETSGTIRIRKEKEELIVDADKEFLLRFPIPKKTKTAELTDDSQVYTATVSKAHGSKFALFNLPALRLQRLQVNYR